MTTKINTNTGFTILFVSLVVTLILSISLSIAHITLSQILLSSAGKESQFAFYNADSGIECALYYEYNISDADGSPIFPASGNTQPQTPIVCDDVTATVSTTQSDATTTTMFSINPSGGNCTGSNLTKPSYTVKVDKSVINAYSNKVYIESRGYNTCDANSVRRVERGLYVKLID